MTKKKDKKTTPLIDNLLGWYGAIATLLAYCLISFGVLKPLELKYQLLNLSGAIGLAIICFYKKTYQPLFVNIIWSLIALLAIIYILTNK